MKNIYVLGFVFDTSFRVVMVKKNRPESMAGKWNGVGGKVEPGETPRQAMIREFREEAGLEIPEWQHFATLSDATAGYRIFCFVSVQTPEILNEVRTQESEEIRVIAQEKLMKIASTGSLMNNLTWLIPLSISLTDSEIPVHIEYAYSAVAADQNCLPKVLQKDG